MSKNLFGFAKPLSNSDRVAPPMWKEAKPFVLAGTYTGEVVPENVYQIGVYVMGAGGNGVANNAGGGGGGFAFGIIDVVPGEILPSFTVGAVGANSTFGESLLIGGFGANGATTTGGSGGTGTASPTLRGARTASGGVGGGGAGSGSGGGGGAGSFYGKGGKGGDSSTAGALGGGGGLGGNGGDGDYSGATGGGGSHTHPQSEPVYFSLIFIMKT